jgi:hypothetical protein
VVRHFAVEGGGSMRQRVVVDTGRVNWRSIGLLYVLGAGKELCLNGRSLRVTLGSLAVTVIKWVRRRNSVKVVHASSHICYRGASPPTSGPLHHYGGLQSIRILPELLRAE